jgi:hypothetical protein
MAIIAIRISTVIYYLLFIGFIIAGFLIPPEAEEFNRYMAWFISIFTLPFIIFLEVLIIHLKRRRYWAWIGGLIVGAMYAPSLFLPLGIMILIGLLSEQGRLEFGIGNRTEQIDRQF